ncbi:CLK4-associating serine/arginine rich protein [Halotydeus destructor]|nr:CLK4-associating serine/arginine rich protein [Halotydeus destructor]
MWQEARKHEKKIKGMMVDFKRRAERRRDFYEKIRKDPAQFLQVHGRQLKVHIDGNISQAAEQCLVPWAADANTLIDRFDARAYLDRLPEDSSVKEKSHGVSTSLEERDSNYERWKNLVQNEFLSNPETKVLAHIANEESGKFRTCSCCSAKCCSEEKAG